MQDLLKSFVRDHSGGWRCVAPANVQLPAGRVQVTPGSVFMKGTRLGNIDLAAVLDEQEALNKRDKPKR